MTSTSPELGALLGQSRLLEGCPAEVLARLSAHCQHRRYRVREVIYTQAQDPYCYYLAGGRVRLSHVVDHVDIFLGMIRPGGYFGMQHLLASKALTRAVCLDASQVVAIPVSAIHDLKHEFPEFFFRLLEQYQLGYDILLERFGRVILNNVPARLTFFLLHLADNYGNPRKDGGVLLDVGLSHQDLACAIGTSRETATTLLNFMKNEGLLTIGRKTITLLDMEALRERSEGD